MVLAGWRLVEREAGGWRLVEREALLLHLPVRGRDPVLVLVLVLGDKILGECQGVAVSSAPRVELT